MYPDPYVIKNTSQAWFVLFMGIALFGVGGWGAVYAFLPMDGGWVVRIVLFVISAVFALLGIGMIASFTNVRKSFLSIGSQGLLVNRGGVTTGIGWHEIAWIGIDVMYARGPQSGLTPRQLRTRLVIRVRMVPVYPGFGGRPDMVGFETQDEPAPYTHKIVLAHGAFATETNVPEAETAAGAIYQFAPQKFTGVEYRQSLVGRYS